MRAQPARLTATAHELLYHLAGLIESRIGGALGEAFEVIEHDAPDRLRHAGRRINPIGLDAILSCIKAIPRIQLARVIAWPLPFGLGDLDAQFARIAGHCCVRCKIRNLRPANRANWPTAQ